MATENIHGKCPHGKPIKEICGRCQAEEDARLFGTGFMVDDERIPPGKVRIVKHPWKPESK